MIVVAGTSPLNYSLQIKCESLLPSGAGRRLVRKKVSGGLGNPLSTVGIAFLLFLFKSRRLPFV